MVDGWLGWLPNRLPVFCAVFVPLPNRLFDGALEAGAGDAFSSFFAPNKPVPAVVPVDAPPPNSPLPPLELPDVAVFPNEKVGLLVPLDWFGVLPNRPPLLGALPVEAPKGLAPEAGCAALPNSGFDDDCAPDVPLPKSPPLPPAVAPPKGEFVLPEEPGVPPKLKGEAMLAPALLLVAVNLQFLQWAQLQFWRYATRMC